MNVITLSMFLDYKCNFACDHCSVGSSLQTEYELQNQYIKQALDQSESLDSLQLVVFTGGEVMLQEEKLLDAISSASEHGYRTRIVTNAWWAKDKQKAEKMINKLVNAGLNEINTSYDDFHTEYMSPENIATMVEASLDSEIEQTSIAMIIGDTNPKYDAERMIQILKERLGAHPNDFSDQLTILEDTVSPLGRGAHSVMLTQKLLRSGSDRSPSHGISVSEHYRHY